MKIRRSIIAIVIVLICLLSYFVNLEFESMLGLRSKSEPATPAVQYPGPEGASGVQTLYITQSPAPYPETLLNPRTKTIPKPAEISGAYPPPALIVPTSAQASPPPDSQFPSKELSHPTPYSAPEYPLPVATAVPEIMEPSPILQILPILGILIGLLIGIALGFMVHAITTFLRMKSSGGLVATGLVGLSILLYFVISTFVIPVYLTNTYPNLYTLVAVTTILLGLPILIKFQVDHYHFPWWVAIFSQLCNFLWIFILYRIISWPFEQWTGKFSGKLVSTTVATIFDTLSLTLGFPFFALVLTVIILELVSANQIFYSREFTLRIKFRSISKRNAIYFLIGFLAYIALSILLFLLFSRVYMGILLTWFFVPFFWVAVLLFLTIKRWRWLAYGLIGGYLLNLLGTTIQILSSGVISGLFFIGWAAVGAPILPWGLIK